MFRDIFSNVSGIEFFPIMTLIFFFTFFIAVIIMAQKLDKKFISYMGNLPLENEDENMIKIEEKR